MSVKKKFQIKWYHFALSYHELLLKDCLHPDIRRKLEKKINNHRKKLEKLTDLTYT